MHINRTAASSGVRVGHDRSFFSQRALRIVRKLLAASFAVAIATLGSAQKARKLWDVTDLGNPLNYSVNVQVEGTGTLGGEPCARMRMGGLWAQFGQIFVLPKVWSLYTGFTARIQNLENRDVSIGYRFDRDPLHLDYVAGSIFLKANETKLLYLDESGFNPLNFGMLSPMPVFQEYYTPTFPYERRLLNTVFRWSFYSRETTPFRVNITSLYGQQCNYSVTGMVDRYGQFTRWSWPWKVTSVQNMRDQKVAEDADLAANPGNGETYGSTTMTGTATGEWRLTRTPNGRYYFVSPAGRYFWSFGIDSVSMGAPTITAGRESMFLNLPTGSDPRTQFYDTIVRNGQTKQTYSHFTANVSEKLGTGWETAWKSLAGKRMRSWGINTLGSGSDRTQLVQNSMPFAWPITTMAFPVRLPTPHAFWGPLPDPFSPTFQDWMVSKFSSQLGPIKDDTRLLGVYVDSEYVWGVRAGSLRDRYEVPLAALAASSTQPAKGAFVTSLQSQYGPIDALNTRWATNFASWTALLQNSTTLTNAQVANAQADLSGFLTDFAKAYYWRVDQALETVAPKALYLGSKDAYGWAPDEIFEAEALYADVISVDQYDDVAHTPWDYFNSLGRPVIIAEFSFNGREGNSFPNLNLPGCETSDQATRAVAARAFLDRALDTDNIVGALFYRFMDFSISGDADDDINYAFGVVDVTDRPYPDLVEMFRDFSSTIYANRGQ